MIKLAIALFAVNSVSTTTAAQNIYCIEPSEPFCIDAYGMFDNDYSFEACRMEVESYLDEVDNYAECLISEVQREIRMKREEADEIVERFNCKAQGNTYCY